MYIKNKITQTVTCRVRRWETLSLRLYCSVSTYIATCPGLQLNIAADC